MSTPKSCRDNMLTILVRLDQANRPKTLIEDSFGAMTPWSPGPLV
jgi:hypothetical protein